MKGKTPEIGVHPPLPITGVSVSPETGSYKKNLPYLSNG